jgi:hypothetical protein
MMNDESRLLIHHSSFIIHPLHGGAIVSDLVRFSVSLEADLLEQFDRYCREGRFATRSEAVRQLLRDTLTSHSWAADA